MTQAREVAQTAPRSEQVLLQAPAFRIYPNLLWFFLGGMALAMLVFAFLLTSVLRQVVIENAEREGLTLARLLAVKFLRVIENHHQPDWTPQDLYPNLYEVYEQEAMPLGVVWLQVYDAEGTLLFSPDPTFIGRSRGEIEGADDFPITENQPHVELVDRNELGYLADRVQVDVLEIYIPLDDPNAPFRVFEIYLDASSYQQRLNLLLAETLGLLLTVTIILGAVTWTLTRQADAIIQHQFHRLQEALQALQRLQDFRTYMIQTLAHDIKNQLGALVGSIEYLRWQCDPQGEEARLAENSQLVASQIRMMLENLIEVTRLEEGELPVRRRPLLLQDLFREVAASLDPLMRIQDKVFQVDIDTETPPVLADRHLLLRVLQNLLYNALEHTPPGTSIRMKAHADGQEHVVITVEDTGPGIAAKDLPHIFEKFYRGEGGRTGLGLTFCKLAVEAMKGSIEVETQEGKGTTFRVVLPASTT